jgi:hypothetical protein
VNLAPALELSSIMFLTVQFFVVILRVVMLIVVVLIVVAPPFPDLLDLGPPPLPIFDLKFESSKAPRLVVKAPIFRHAISPTQEAEGKLGKS